MAAGRKERPQQPACTDGPPMGAACARSNSAENIFGARNENAGAACLAPDALVACSRRTVVVVAGEELSLVDPQLSVEEMQLFDASMRMRRVARTGREADQHADPMPFGIG